MGGKLRLGFLVLFMKNYIRKGNFIKERSVFIDVNRNVFNVEDFFFSIFFKN